VPGYIGDESPEGLDSAAHGSGFCSDPTQSFDDGGRLFYAFICGSPEWSLFVTTYKADGARYARTALVASGAPAPDRQGPFQDKPNLAVDQTDSPGVGNIYVAWTRDTGIDTTVVRFSRSTDHGRTFSVPLPVAAGPAAGVFTDLAVGPDGAVYLVWRSGAFNRHGGGVGGIWLARSTDFGKSFGSPRLVQSIIPFDSAQFTGIASETGAVACGLLSPCPSGLTFPRFWSNPAVAADATGVHVVWNAERPDGQAKIFVRNSPYGASFPTPARQLDSVPAGHQWFPDLATADGVLTAVFYDSRSDPAYSPDLPPGDTADGLSSGDVVDAWSASSSDGGQTWTEQRVSTVSSTPNWNQGQTPFFGDYIYVSAVPGGASAVWTDSRDVVPGIPAILLPFFPCDPTDPSLLQSDPCFSAGGLDDNIYARRLR
jgi:hypothetical protein